MKPKLSDFKKLLAEMTVEELRAELLKLFQKLEQVQMFYAQDLLSKEDRQKLLDEAKKKIYSFSATFVFAAFTSCPSHNIS